MALSKLNNDSFDDTAVHGRRNLIINGAMQVAQRATATTTVSGAGVYDTIDRLKLWESTDGAYTSEQSTEAPDGFTTSVKLAVTTADTSLASNQYACIAQLIEAQNLQHLGYGTNAAKTVTISFYVRSNKTGIYCLALTKEDSTTYHHVKEFTINSADTWERKTLTIAPDSNIKASGGAIANDNGRGFRVFIGLAWGTDYHTTKDTWTTGNDFATSNQVNWMDSTSNNFYFTGFQVEVGDKATPFEHRSFADELHRCQRYYAVRENTAGSLKYYSQPLQAYNTTSVYGVIADYPVTMRATPTVTQSGTFGAYIASSAGASMPSTIGNLFATSHAWGSGGWTSGSGLVAGNASVMYADTNAKLMADAEL